MATVKIGFAPTRRAIFSAPAAVEYAGYTRNKLKELGVEFVDIDDINEEGVIVFHLHVAPDDMGRVIGKQGRIAKAIRTVMRATANRADSKILVEID